MNIELKHILAALELNDAEITVFMTTLELGAAVASKIAATAGLNRITAYEALKRLSTKGLVVIRSHKGTAVRHFEAVDIEVLMDKLESKKAALQQTIDTTKELKDRFHSLFARVEAKPVVLFYEGREGLKTALSDTLAQKPHELLAFISADLLEDAFEKSFLDAYWKKRTELKIPSRGILPKTAAATALFTPERNQQELRRLKFMSDEQFKFTSLFDIYDDNVAILSLAHGNEHGIIIRSKSIAASMRGLFESMWAML